MKFCAIAMLGTTSWFASESRTVTDNVRTGSASGGSPVSIVDGFCGITVNVLPLIWEGIVVSSLAGEKGGLGALGLAKRARACYEQSLKIDDHALDGSAYNSLGVLYYRVPGWPIGFGDRKKADELIRKALAINPDGIDPNYFYGDFLLSTGRPAEALPYLQRALSAAPRPGRENADKGRRAEAAALMEKARSQM